MNKETLESIKKLQHVGMSQEDAFKVYDSLEPVSIDFMIGKWKGSELKAGHIMEGILTIAPWHGKVFYDAEKVTPLLFDDKKGHEYAVNPRKILSLTNCKPLFNFARKFAQRVINEEVKFNKYKFDWFYKIFKTNYPYARLRQIEYRGKVSAAMVYDELAIIDIFRKLDENTVLGVMDFKGKLGKSSYFFMLERE